MLQSEFVSCTDIYSQNQELHVLIHSRLILLATNYLSSILQRESACDWSSTVHNVIYNKLLTTAQVQRRRWRRGERKCSFILCTWFAIQRRREERQHNKCMNVEYWFPGVGNKIQQIFIFSSFTSPVTPFSCQSSPLGPRRFSHDSRSLQSCGRRFPVPCPAQTI